MKAFAGTRWLIRLILRIDLVRLPLWILLTVGLVALTIPQLTQAYSSAEQRMGYAAATAPSVVTRLWNGAITGPSLGEIAVVETAFLIFLMIALLNIFLVVRHTRKNEESGRSELLGSLVVGRQAMLTATLMVAFAANILCGFLLYTVMISNYLPADGALLYSVGISLAGMFFAVTAAVAAQLFQSGRAANSAAAAVFGVALLTRGAGDALGTLLPSGLGVQTGWISYLSPLGWVTGAKPFADQQPVWLLLFVPTLLLGMGLAYYLLARRDSGAGIFAPRLGKASAQKGLLTRFGLLWRLNRTSCASWLVGMVLVAATLGGVADEFQSLITENEEMKQMLESFGGVGSATDIMFSATFVIAAIALAAYVVQLLVRMHSEEVSGRLGLVLSTARSRTQWLVSQTIFAFVTAAVGLLITGMVAGFVYALVSGGGAVSQTLELGGAIMVQLPAVLVLSSVSVLLFAVLPRFFVLLSWLVLGGSLLLFQLGALLQLPQWVLNISPFTHSPTAPAHDISTTPLLILTAVFICIYVMSLKLFTKRDLLTG